MSGFLKAKGKQWGHEDGDDLPPQKRISTPAGLRLSVVMNKARGAVSPDAGPSPITPNFSPDPSLGSIHASSLLKGLDDSPLSRHDWPTVRAVEEAEPSPKFSEKSIPISVQAQEVTPDYLSRGLVAGQKQDLLRWESDPSAGAAEQKQTERRRGGLNRRRIMLILLILALLLLALIVGLAVGLSRKKASPSTTSNPDTDTAGSSASAATGSSATSTAPISKDFPTGSYSIQTFLDTVGTDCTSDAAAWSCSPGKTLYDTLSDPSKALASFDFAISGSSGSYSLAPLGNGLSAGFKSTSLTIAGAGTSTESYRFRVIMDKAIDATINGTPATCTYTSATFIGQLFTKQANEWPAKGQSTPATAYDVWPYRAKIEQDASGENVPECRKRGSNEIIDSKLVAQDPMKLCSCIYRNFRTV